LLQLLNPIALFASAAVIIPVLIHLWNIRKGKTLKVGSIALLAESSRQPARSRRITNWPLFLLRCLLLILLALLLANPLWQTDKKNTSKGWVMISRHHINNAYQQYGVTIDSLLKAGLELRDLSPSFDKIDLGDTVALTIPVQQPASTWALLKTLDAGLPKDFPVYLFSTNQLNNYYGERPVVQFNLHWHSINEENETTSEPAYSFITPEEKTKTIKWITSTAGNYYAEDSAGTAVNPDTTPVRITIYPGKNNTDAYYLKAAIKAISQYTSRQILISMQPSSEPQQLIFWLQDTDPPESILASLTPSGTLFQYDQGIGISIFAPFNNGLYTLAEDNDQAFYKYASGPSLGTSLWSLSDGRPLLTAEEKDGRKIIHFKSRFNPQWTDLVWQEDFVRALLPVILSAPIKEKEDLRKIDSLQAIPRKTVAPVYTHIESSLFESKADLSLAIWIAIVIVFIIERVLAHHQPKQQKDA
jgi:hypothetical protein